MIEGPKPDQAPKEKAKPGKAPGSRHGKGGGKSERPGRPTIDRNGKVSRGRPPALTKEVHKAILYNVAELAMMEGPACQAEGLDPSIAGKWKGRGAEALAKWPELNAQQRATEMRYVMFFEALRDARPKFIKANLTTIAKAADGGDWRAAKARLEMADPQTYGRRMLVGNDPKHPLPQIPVLGGVMILPDNRRLQVVAQAPAATPSLTPQPAAPPREKTDASDHGTKGV